MFFSKTNLKMIAVGNVFLLFCQWKVRKTMLIEKSVTSGFKNRMLRVLNLFLI